MKLTDVNFRSSSLQHTIRASALLVIMFFIGVWLGGLYFFVRGIFTDLDLVYQAMSFGSWPPQAVRAAIENIGLPAGLPAWVWLSIEVMLALSFGSTGLLIFFRKRDLSGALFALILVLTGTHIAGPVSFALAEGWPAWLLPAQVLSTQAFVFYFMLLFIFPNGRFVPRAGAWLTLVVLAYYTLRPLSRQALGSSEVDVLLSIAYFAAGLASQVYRYLRVSSLSEKLQTRWAVAAFALFLALIVGFWLAFPVIFLQNRPPTGSDVLTYLAFFLSLTLAQVLFVISLVIAILHYRLWEIDVIIRRTLVYSALTALLALIYSASVILLQMLFNAFTGQASRSPLAVVLSTLAIAALFNPLRWRIQQFIDRRFYRKNYNAEHMLQTVAVSLRDEADLDELSGRLLRLVDETIQPEAISLWLRRPREKDAEKQISRPGV